MSPALTKEEIATFHQYDYVYLREAFPRSAALDIQEFMWSELMKLGIDRTDQTTWRRHPHGLNKTAEAPIYQSVASPRMYEAFNLLLGKDTWKPPKKWGGFHITLPTEQAKEAREVPFGWHWDGDPPRRETHKAWGLFVFTFYSSVGPRNGGTWIVEGSGQMVTDFVGKLRAEGYDLKRKEFARRFFKSDPWLDELKNGSESGDRFHRFVEQLTRVHGVDTRAVELTGEPGDAVICHPTIVHSAGIGSPRFMKTASISQY